MTNRNDEITNLKSSIVNYLHHNHSPSKNMYVAKVGNDIQEAYFFHPASQEKNCTSIHKLL